MTDTNSNPAGTSWNSEKFAANLAKRKRSERRFRLLGLLAIVTALTLLAILLFSIFSKGYTAFVQTYITLDVTFTESVIDKDGKRDPEILRYANYTKLVQDALRAKFPEVEGRRNLRTLFSLVSRMIPRAVIRELKSMP